MSTQIPAEAVDQLQAIYATLRRSDDLAAERVATALVPVMRASAATCRSALTTSATRADILAEHSDRPMGASL